MARATGATYSELKTQMTCENKTVLASIIKSIPSNSMISGRGGLLNYYLLVHCGETTAMFFRHVSWYRQYSEIGALKWRKLIFTMFIKTHKALLFWCLAPLILAYNLWSVNFRRYGLRCGVDS